MEVYWIEVEYVSGVDNPTLTKPGVVYAFVKSKDALEAYQAVCNALSQRKLLPTNWFLIEPYKDMLLYWDNDEQAAHFEHLYEKAKMANECVFDDFYNQDEFERYEDDTVYWADVEFRFHYETDPPAQGGFVNILVKAWDALEAYRKVQNALFAEDLEPILWIRLTPVTREQEWEDENVSARFQRLWDSAESSGECEWGEIYAYGTDEDKQAWPKTLLSG